MRRALYSCCLCYLLTACGGCAKTTADPQAVLEKAIAAHGGEANLTKHRTGRTWGTDTGTDVRIDWEEYFDAPGRWVRRAEGTLNGRKIRYTRLFDEGALWLSDNGGAA